MSETEPTLRVVGGRPTAEELAALVVVLSARTSTEAPPERPSRSGWADRARAVRAPLTPGPGAWQASARDS